jgi:redox-sensitive bicupin YhaK (pirin superfamily)
MDVAPHPHIGLQTVTWLLEGEIIHHDSRGARLLLIGGPPFPEPILMWWNFVARTPEVIAAARTAWEQRQGFGEVKAYQGPRLSAPPLVRLARPNPAS